MNREIVMSTVSIHPSTLSGIKRLAKTLKRERGTKHSESLNEAARQAGFENFRHAQNALPVTTSASSSHVLFITAYWRERNGLKKGRETLPIRLSAPWESLVTRRQLKCHRALMEFRGDAPDHLERIHDVNGQEHAREAVCAAARAMQFIDATKLRPSTRAYRAFEKIHPTLPGLDHSSSWIDPTTTKMLVIDEPYDNAVKGYLAERAEWAAKHRFAVETPGWPGLYFPNRCPMFLLSEVRDGIPLQPIADLLNRLPMPFVASGWTGESVPYSPVFCSPGRSRMRTKKRERQSPSAILRPYRNSVGFVETLVGPGRRPDARMPISAHQRAASLLKTVLASTHDRKGVCNQVGRVRCELDEWVQREYSRAELSDDEFHGMYYGDEGRSESLPPTDEERVHHIERLDEVAILVERYYPDCVPRRHLIRSLRAAQKSLAHWKLSATANV